MIFAQQRSPLPDTYINEEPPVSITHKMVLTFGLILATAVAGISGLAILQSRQAAVDAFAESSGQYLRQVDYSLTTFLDQVAQDAAFLAAEPLVRDSHDTLTRYLDNRDTQPMTPSRNVGTEADLYALYSRFAEANPGLAYVYMGSADGGYIQWPEGNIGAEYDPRERPFYQAALRQPGEVVRTEAYYFASDDATIISSVRTVEDDSGQVVGVQGVDVSLAGLMNMINDIEFGEQGYLVLLEENGTVLAHPGDPSAVFQNVESLDDTSLAQLQALAHGGEAISQAIQHDGEVFQATIYRSSVLGWSLIGLIPRHEMLAGANRLSWQLGLLGLLFLLLAILAAGAVARYLTAPIRAVSQQMQEIASGEADLTQRLAVTSRDEVGELAIQFNRFTDNIHDVLLDVRRVSRNVREAAVAISSDNEDLARRSEGAAANLQETSASMEQISSTVQHTAAASRQADELAQGAATAARESGSAVIRAVDLMQEIQATSDEIANIITLIDGIAFQTNLLALNASVEAARAGQHGRGFAVVAEEVRLLAKRSSEASQGIRSLVADSRDKVSRGSREVHTVGEAVQGLVANVERVAGMLGEISLAASEQSDGVGQVNQAVSELDRMTQQNTQLVEASRTAAYRLTEQAETLAQRVGGFVLKETTATDDDDEAIGSRLPAPADAQYRSGGTATV